MFTVYLVRPHWLGEEKNAARPGRTADDMGKAILAGPTPGKLVFSLVAFFAIIMGALGGIWLGFFTPSEGVVLLFAFPAIAPYLPRSR